MADPDIYSLFASDDEATAQEQAAALAAVLRRQREGAAFDRGAGNLALMSGDKVLSNFGHAQLTQARDGEQLAHVREQMLAQAGGQRLQRAIEAQRAKTEAEWRHAQERHQLSQEELQREQLAQGRWSLSNPGYGQTYKVNGRTGDVVPIGEEREKPTPGSGIKGAAEMRKEFFSNQVAKDMQNVAVNYEKVMTAAKDPSAAGDIALIYGFMKNQDPGSTVREGEFATAQNAGGVEERARAAWNKLIDGERLTKEQRADFISRSKQAYDAHYSRYKPWADQFTEVARRNGINPSDVVLDLGFGKAAVDASGKADKQVINGKTYFKKPNGKWAVQE